MIKIFNANIVDPVTKLKGRYDVEIDKGIILKVAPTSGTCEEGAIDATG